MPFGLCHSVFSRGGGAADTNTRECSALGHLVPGALRSCGLHTLRCQPRFQALLPVRHVTQAQRRRI